MAVFKSCVGNSAVCLALFPVSMFHKQWGLMKPGLQWACVCPSTSSAVLPMPDTDLIRPYLACVPLPIHNMSSGMKKLGVLQGLCKGSVTPAHHFPTLPAGKPHRVVTVWHPGVLAGWHLLNSASHVRVSCPLKLKNDFLPLCKLWKDMHCLFLGLTSLKLA